MKWPTITFLLVCAIAALLFVSGCAGFGEGGSIRPGWGPAKTPTPAGSPTQTPPSVTVATPFPTTASATPGLPTPTFRNPPASVTPVTAFTTILETTYYFDYNNTALYYDLTSPPLIVDYTVTRPSEYSWFEITVRNKDDGQVILQEGFGKTYNNWIPEQQLTIRNPGTYQFELRGGHDVRLAFAMRVPA